LSVFTAQAVHVPPDPFLDARPHLAVPRGRSPELLEEFQEEIVFHDFSIVGC
jgi:hypothetical protein